MYVCGMIKYLAIISLAFLQCKKLPDPIKNDQPTCKNLQGTWWCIKSDSLITDSLVITFSKQILDTVYYTCNIPVFNSELKHNCPYTNPTEYLTITKNGKKYVFRPNY